MLVRGANGRSREASADANGTSAPAGWGTYDPPAPAVRLRAAVARQARRPTIGDELAAAIDAFVADARERGLLPETMLVALKAECRRAPGLAPGPAGTPQGRLLELVVTRSIERYFGLRAGAGAREAGDVRP